MLTIKTLPCLQDNYIYIICDQANKQALVIDPGDATPVIDFLEQHNLSLTTILITHHHFDHMGGVAQLEHLYQLKHQINFTGEILGQKIISLDTSGHTESHFSYYMPDLKAVFTGDSLFIMGIGRMLGGSFEQAFTTMRTLSTLPNETKIYVGHEYSLTNARFSQEIEPDNKDIKNRLDWIKNQRAHHMPTVPSTIEWEKKTNLFMRAQTLEDFTHLRYKRDQFS